MPSQLLKLYGGGFSPAQYAPALWLDASDTSTMYQERTGASATTLVASDADPVGTWLDKSGNARHVTAPSDAKRPTWKASAQNGRSVTLFDGTDDALTITDNLDLSSSAAATVFMVLKNNNSTAAAKAALSCNSGIVGNQLSWTSQNGAVYASIAGGATSYTSFSDSSNVWAVVSMVYDGSLNNSSRLSVWLSGSSKTLTVTGTLGTTIPAVSSFWVGNTDNNTRPSAAQIAEIIIYSSSAFSNSQRQQVERYLASKWGITLL